MHHHAAISNEHQFLILTAEVASLLNCEQLIISFKPFSSLHSISEGLLQPGTHQRHRFKPTGPSTFGVDCLSCAVWVGQFVESVWTFQVVWESIVHASLVLNTKLIASFRPKKTWYFRTPNGQMATNHCRKCGDKPWHDELKIGTNNRSTFCW
jgi:hypothetical protein